MNGSAVEIIVGVNLAMLIKLASVRETSSLEQAVVQAQDAASKYIYVASQVLGAKPAQSSMRDGMKSPERIGRGRASLGCLGQAPSARISRDAMGKPEKTERRPAKKARCAIYTRKSSEEGLEQAFNSLDAQREARSAFILSQKHEGWTVLPAPSV
jgi:hypothetical protein